ncbi:MAG: hypothetical protein WD077_11145 [Bacteroidia bacterium]
MLRNYIFFSWLFMAVFSLPVLAQRTGQESPMSLSLIGIQYTYNFPYEDLDDRFGPISAIGGSYTFKHNSNFYISGEYNFLFNGNVRENPVSNIASPSTGLLIDGDGRFDLMELQLRGTMVQAKIGKIFPVAGPNANSGIAVAAGAGFMEHRIHFNTRSDKLPQLEGEYKKGYDRLTNGWLLSQSIGYFHLSNSGFVNFQASIEITEGFTQNRRDWDNQLMRRLDEPRLDLMAGLRLTWYIPLYKRSGSTQFY